MYTVHYVPDVDAVAEGTAVFPFFFFFGLFFHMIHMVTHAMSRLQLIDIHAMAYAAFLALVPGNPASVA